MLEGAAGPRTRMLGTVTESGEEAAVVASSKMVVGVSGGREASEASWYWRLLRLEPLRSVVEPRVEPPPLEDLEEWKGKVFWGGRAVPRSGRT